MVQVDRFSGTATRSGDYLFPIVFFFALAGLLYLAGILLWRTDMYEKTRRGKVGNGLMTASKVSFLLGIAVGMYAYWT